MQADIRRLNIFVCLVFLLSLVFVLLKSYPIEPFRLYFQGETNEYITAKNLDLVPDEIISDAINQAESLYGSNQQAVESLASQMLGSYLECLHVDTIIIFNPGGFGWGSVEDSLGWLTVMDGIVDLLESINRKVIVFDYERSHAGFTGMISEAVAFWGLHPLKSQELALRIDFITRHLPDVDVIVSGESNGSVVVEETLRLLQDNPRVYAIQTGPPVIQHNIDSERSLVLRHNGKIPDSFSQGDIFTILRSNLEALFGIYQEQPGDILFYIGAPGHHYSWEYDDLREVITLFLMKHLA